MLLCQGVSKYGLQLTGGSVTPKHTLGSDRQAASTALSRTSNKTAIASDISAQMSSTLAASWHAPAMPLAAKKPVGKSLPRSETLQCLQETSTIAWGSWPSPVTTKKRDLQRGNTYSLESAVREETCKRPGKCEDKGERCIIGPVFL